MKNIHKYIMLFVMAFAVASCAEEEIIENKVVGKPGEEVKFSLSLNKDSRTVYGDETNGTFPIYWVDGDKVQVHSPHASDDNNTSEYEVVLPKGITQPNYAENLKKNGEHGVQWGEGYTDTDGNTGLHDFYSIYPSGNYNFLYNKNDKSVLASLKIASHQEINYINNKFVHDMSNCLMYATSPKVEMTDGAVELSYKPLSTVLWFELTVGNQSSLQDSEKHFKITGIELKTKTNSIAGSFNFNVSNGKFVSWLGDQNEQSISVNIWDKPEKQQTVAYTIKENTTINFPVFVAPDPNLTLSDMTVIINTDRGTFTKTLSKGDTNLTLDPGKIHKVKLPVLETTSKEWDVATWMKFIPRNVYLSEISIPGTWNSLNPEFQNETSIDEQYKKGIRAFHFDTRWHREYVGISWSGIEYNYTLGIADGNSTGTSGSKYCSSKSPTFSAEFSNILNKVKEDEYMVLVCSFAQGSAQANGANGWIKVISELCQDDRVFDARNLDENTLVGHVLGKVIVIVNVETSINASTKPADVLAENSKCFFNYTPSEVPKARFVSSNDNDDELLAANSDVYWTTSTTVSQSDIKVYASQAQISSNGESGIQTTSRGYAPTLEERLKVLNLIVNWSKNNYNSTNYKHDQWIYMGLGGYRTDANNAETVADSHGIVENTYNPWLYNIIKKMDGTSDNPYFPVGIVLMNNKRSGNYDSNIGDETIDLGFKFTDVVKTILLLNNEYRLQYNETAPKDYDPNYYQSGSGDVESPEGGDIVL